MYKSNSTGGSGQDVRVANDDRLKILDQENGVIKSTVFPCILPSASYIGSTKT